MGYTTDFVGWVQIDPPLRDEETDYLRAFNQTRRFDRKAGPYVVLDHPLADDEDSDTDYPEERYDKPAPGEPSLRCPWTPVTSGRYLSYDGCEKAYEAVGWLDYLIRTFLAPGAAAAESGEEVFRDFTFDHICDGAVAACRRDTGRLSVILVTDNVVDERVILPGVPESVVWAGMPYEEDVDRYRQRAAVRRAAYDPRLASRDSVTVNP